MACCVLHNICILQNDYINNFMVEDENDGQDDVNAIHFQERNAGAVLKRDTLSRNLFSEIFILVNNEKHIDRGRF
ncbi:hypothetical protein KUTeg_022203 [Tegillarca granosa]|uniref:DDE Tnp4 domain-containing protein n=1 Tax=Tegillarca granosa TaxID=220873 RepID=A0ABQ9E5R1_TEGGR|nr:hypothetical protein KUTeg_022203 [Tegillarca granosa]